MDFLNFGGHSDLWISSARFASDVWVNTRSYPNELETSERLADRQYNNPSQKSILTF